MCAAAQTARTQEARSSPLFLTLHELDGQSIQPGQGRAPSAGEWQAELHRSAVPEDFRSGQAVLYCRGLRAPFALSLRLQDPFLAASDGRVIQGEHPLNKSDSINGDIRTQTG